MSLNHGGPAFPSSVVVRRCDSGLLYDENDCYEEVRIPVSGMTLRDYFAGQALAGILSAHDDAPSVFEDVQTLAEEAYVIADAMLAVRTKMEPAR